MPAEGSLGAVEVDRPAPGEELNPGRPTEPRQAATVIVLRGGADRLEVLLVQRNPQARFMGGAWVFPGGAVDPREDHRAAAVREVAEEAGIALPAAQALVEFSRWITPAQLRIRFDTRFFLAPAPAGARPRADGGETVGVRWIAPPDALAAQRRGELELVFPTVKTLEALSAFRSADEALRCAVGREVEPIEPRIVIEGGVARIVLPGEP
jgi:8-oxo-dGTP pyrophosphatase MutT (NUDIX family)